MDEGDTKVKAIVEGTDNTIITLSDEATAEIKAIADGHIAEWGAAMDAAGLSGLQMLDDARMLIEKHNK